MAADNQTAAQDSTAKDEKQAVLPQKGWISQRIDAVIRFAIRTAFRASFRLKVNGAENLKNLDGQRLVFTPNHISMLDGAVLLSAIPQAPAFAVDIGANARFNQNPVYRALMARANLFPINSSQPQAIKSLTRLAQTGAPIAIFPEGRVTSTGNLMQIYDGAAVIADNADATIVPIYMDGLQFMKFGSFRLLNHPSRFFPKLTVTIGAPRKLDLPEGLNKKERREMRHRQLEQIMQEMPLAAIDPQQSLMDALHDAASNYGRGRAILSDVEAENITYRKVLMGAYALGDRLKRVTKKGENVGFLLPNSNGASVVFWALQAYGRVPAMLNAKAENADMLSYTQTASLKTIVTSRRFVELAGLQDKIEALQTKCKIVYVDDLRGKIGLFGKLKAVLRAQGLLWRPRERAKGADPSVILFTSGSEGPPKGVVLSSTNILSNVAQMRAVSPLDVNDRFFNAMPIFHCFGLCGGLIMPMLQGMHSLQYPTPLDGKNIPKVVYGSDSTVMFGTDTFLNLYARTATEADFARLKLVFAGAEALKDSTYQTYFDRYGVRICQGYGLTEAAPAVSLNVPGAFRKDSVGRFLPGIKTKLEPVEGIEKGGRLQISGPNIMMGYLKHDKPGVLQPPPGGWHDTGDIVTINDDGFIKLSGRAKRFAKIGGEMVSLDTIEDIARKAAAKPEFEQAVILSQDADGADSIVLFTMDPAIKRDTLAKAAQELQKSQLGLPKNQDIHVIGEIPKLPTGKTDYVSLKKIFKEKAEAGKGQSAPKEENAPVTPPPSQPDNQGPSTPAP